MKTPTPTKAEIKRLAKQLATDHGLKPTHAHEVIARSFGYRTYNHFLSGKPPEPRNP